MMVEKKKSLIQSESGIVTADFLFSFMLASLLTAFLFAMCFTFTIIEVSQYISYSSARAALPSHKDFTAQKARAEKKLAELVNDPVFSALVKNGWFNLQLKDMMLGETPNDFYSDYKMEPIPGASPVPFFVPAAGVRLSLVAKILNMNLGPLGKIESENGDGFALTIGSLLFREPNVQECKDAMNARYQKILSLDAKYGSIAGGSAGEAIPMEDSGC